MFRRKKKILNEIRGDWGHFIERKRDFKLIALYHDLCKDKPSNLVNDITWDCNPPKLNVFKSRIFFSFFY